MPKFPAKAIRPISSLLSIGSCDFEERPATRGDQWCAPRRLVGHRGICRERRTELQTYHGNYYWVSNDSGPNHLFSENSVFEEQTVKIYEDFLSDLGIASLSCRCRHGPQGFELRLRWFIFVATHFPISVYLMRLVQLWDLPGSIRLPIGYYQSLVLGLPL